MLTTRQHLLWAVSVMLLPLKFVMKQLLSSEPMMGTAHEPDWHCTAVLT